MTTFLCSEAVPCPMINTGYRGRNNKCGFGASSQLKNSDMQKFFPWVNGREVEPLQLWDWSALAGTHPPSVSSGDTAECWGRGFVFDLEDGLTPGGVWSRKRHDDSQGFLVVPVTFPKAAAESIPSGFIFPFSLQYFSGHGGEFWLHPIAGWLSLYLPCPAACQAKQHLVCQQDTVWSGKYSWVCVTLQAGCTTAESGTSAVDWSRSGGTGAL